MPSTNFFFHTLTERQRDTSDLIHNYTTPLDTVKPFPPTQKHQQKQWIRSLLPREHWCTHTVFKTVKIKNLSRTWSVRLTFPPSFLHFATDNRPNSNYYSPTSISFFLSRPPNKHIPKHELHFEKRWLQCTSFLSSAVECGFQDDPFTSQVNFHYFRKNYFH